MSNTLPHLETYKFTQIWAAQHYLFHAIQATSPELPFIMIKLNYLQKSGTGMHNIAM